MDACMTQSIILISSLRKERKGVADTVTLLKGQLGIGAKINKGQCQHTKKKRAKLQTFFSQSNYFHAVGCFVS